MRKNLEEGIQGGIETDNKPNYAYINVYASELKEVRALIKKGYELKVYPHFVECAGKTFNVNPSQI